MAVFVILNVSGPNAALAAKVAEVYPNDNFHLNPSTWFVKDEGVTAAQVCEKLGIVVDGPVGSVVVVKIEDYFGVASKALWDWLLLKRAS